MDNDETGGPKGKSTMVSRVGHEYVKSVQLIYTLFYLRTHHCYIRISYIFNKKQFIVK